MPYQKTPLRIVSGGLNIATAPDQISDEECQECVNFAPDSYGDLRVRKGHSVVCNTGAPVNNVARAIGQRWQSAAGSIYRGCVSIASGFNSAFVAVIGFKGFSWFMSPEKQGKALADGTFYRWIPEAPKTKPTIKPGVTIETTVVTFDADFTVSPTGDESYPTEGLRIPARSGNAYTATKAIAKDLMTGFHQNDIFKLTVFAKEWASVRGITAEVDVNNGDFKTDYYRAEMAQADLSMARKDTISVYIRKRPLSVDQTSDDKKHYVSFVRIGSTPLKDWRSCVAVRFQVDFIDQTVVVFEAFKMIGDENNTLEGDDFRVCYTHLAEFTIDGRKYIHESNPSPFSDPITVNRTGIDVSALEVSADPQVTGKRLYLTGGVLQDVLQVNADAIPNADTAYQITQGDDDLTDLGHSLENDHGDPPAGASLVGPYFQRLVAFGPGNTIRSTHVDRPFAWPPTNVIEVEDFGSGVGDGIRAMTIRPGFALVYTTNDVKYLQGDVDPKQLPALFSTGAKRGVASYQGVAQLAGTDFADMGDGLYPVSSGAIAERISVKIDPAFKNRATEFVTPLGNLAGRAVGVKNGVIWVSDGSQTFKYEMLTNRWFQDSRGFTSFFDEGESGDLLAGTAAGDVLALERGTTDAGVLIPVAFTSKAFDAGVIDNEKTWNDFTGWYDTKGGVFTVTAILNQRCNDESTLVLGTLGSTAQQRFVFQFNGAEGVKARTLTIRITGSAPSDAFIHAEALNHYIEARAAKSYDTDEQDFNTAHVKELMKVQVDLDNASPSHLILLSDQPGFEMAIRDQLHTFQPSTTRREDEYVLAQSVMGHNLRALLDSEEHRLYGGRFLVQIIGTLLHGSKGNFYRSDPISPGGERVCLYRELYIKYASDSVSDIRAYTELPGGALVEVPLNSNTLPATGGVRFANLETANLKFRATAKGRMIQIVITPAGDLRLEDARVEFKVVGAPSATPWSWEGGEFPLEKTQSGIWQEVWAMPADAPG